uniref:Zinc knuckle CX2CX4HX4C domain-containing protein n=1 Tax=Chenopodium quinoa TaxID=63459 RepID=A0A803MJ98_CHEQI
MDESNALMWGEFMRIKAMVDVSKPLRRGLFVSVGVAKPKWVDIKYERLADFCFYCGVLDHTDRECVKKEEDGDSGEEVVYQYGPWLRSSPLKTSKNAASAMEIKKKFVEKLRSGNRGSSLHYNDPRAVKLGPVGVARKLKFATPSPSGKVSPPKRREVQLTVMLDENSSKLVYRPKLVVNENDKNMCLDEEGGVESVETNEARGVREVNQDGLDKRGMCRVEEVGDHNDNNVDFIRGEITSNLIGGKEGVLVHGVGSETQKGERGWKRIARRNDIIMKDKKDDVAGNLVGRGSGNLKRSLDSSIGSDARGEGEKEVKKIKGVNQSSVGLNFSQVEGLGSNQALEKQ